MIKKIKLKIKPKFFQLRNCAINPLVPPYNFDKLYSKRFPSYSHSPFLMVSISFYKTHTHTQNTKKKKKATLLYTYKNKNLPSYLFFYVLFTDYGNSPYSLLLCIHTLGKNIWFWCIRKPKNQGYNMLIISLYKIIRKILAAQSLIWQVSYT